MKLIFNFLFCLLLTSCPENKIDAVQKANEIVNLFESNLLGDGEEGINKGNYVISSEESWREFLNKINKVNEVSSRFESVVDFSKNIILITVDEVKTSGGFGIKITELRDEKEKIIVFVNRTQPSSEMVTMIMTQPINIVRINKTSKEIIFVER